MATPAPTERTRTYKEFLTPALHRRFVTAAAILSILCWAEAALLSNFGHYVWSWFPIGPAGLRSLLLFGPCLAVFIVRVANIHVGARTTTSPAATAYAQLADAKGIASTLSTIGWYVWSGWFFGEVYIWSRNQAAGLGWVDPGRPYERPRLNENPIFLRSVFIILSITQALTHLVRDYDRILTPADSPTKAVLQPGLGNIPTSQASPILANVPQPLRELYGRAGLIARRVVNLVLFSTVLLTIPLYYGILRHVIWRWTYSVGRTFFRHLPPSAPPSGLLHVGQLIWQVFTTSIMLGLLWETSNAVFDICVAQPPLRRGQPLTSEVKDARGVILQRSKDPNGSLITGLKSKKDVPKSFAFWELSIICTEFDARRKMIYTEVDRKDGSTWNQVCTYCLGEVASISARIAQANAPAPSSQAAPAAPAGSPGLGLPRIADQSVKSDGDVFAKRKPDVVQQIGNVAKALGQSTGGYGALSPHARMALEWSADRVLSKDQQVLLSRQSIEREASGWSADVLRTPLGEPFRQTFARRAMAVLFGTPTSSRANIVHAAKALAKLAVCSLKEDDYGQVSKDIARIVRTFTDAIRQTERFVATLQPSHTDVLFSARDRDVEEVRETLDVLKLGLEEIVLAFGEYADALGLSKKEVREAREASVRKSKPSMAEILS